MYSDQFLKEKIFHILCVFDDYCSSHGIRYSLGYGTLLGAVRHQGFIPWDDDIDVLLDTEEYYKLRNLARIDPYLDQDKRYRFFVPGDKNYCYSFIKVVDTDYKIRERNVSDMFSIGLYIDVFRADYWPENSLSELFQLKKARLILKINEICIRGNLENEKLKRLDKLLVPVDLVFRLLGICPEKLCAYLEKQGMGNRKSRYKGNIMSGSGKKIERHDASIFSGYTYLPFEKRLFPCTDKYAEVLTDTYGDYMSLPDAKHRVSHHSFEIIEEKGR